MLPEYVPLLVMFIAVLGFAFGTLTLSHFLGPRKPNAVKLSPYESGMQPMGDARVRFRVRYYLVAMLFLVFDIEVAFLYPWAVVYRKLLPVGNFILIEMVVFIAILLVGYAYAWKKGALEWD